MDSMQVMTSVFHYGIQKETAKYKVRPTEKTECVKEVKRVPIFAFILLLYTQSVDLL